MISHGITIPIYLDTNTDAKHMLKQFARLYHYGHMLMPALCVSTTATYAGLAISAWRQRESAWKSYGIAAATTVFMIPFTLIFIDGTNRALFGLERQTDIGPEKLGQVQALLRRWGQLHFIRSWFPLFGAVIGLKAL